MQKPDFHFPPIFKKLKRGGPAVVLPKDAGLIIAYSGIGKESFVVEGGAGSAFLTIMLANIVKEVISYETNEEFAKLAALNIEKAGLKNVTIKQKDINEGIEEKNVDLVVLDIPNAEKAVAHAHAAIKKSGTLAAHCLNTEQAKRFFLECEKYFGSVFMSECMVRDYEVRDFGTRPKHFGLWHSGYLVFARK